MPDLASVLWLILPAYVANSSATFAKGRISIDFSKKFPDGRPIFGAGKTFEGFALGVAVGTIAGFLQSVLQSAYGVSPAFSMNITIAFAMSAGALLGDIAGSFVKRRFGLKRGEPVPLLDQLDFVAGSLVVASFFYAISLDTMLVLAIITPVIHLAANVIGYKLGVKKEPW
ncbi:MAG: CDP-2,3-bis-(O-geranylgeranyl)-sn-glycerol synthase [Candidatus Aenigmatarchaeota archaeon]